jgi:hypothetical protein
LCPSSSVVKHLIENPLPVQFSLDSGRGRICRLGLLLLLAFLFSLAVFIVVVSCVSSRMLGVIWRARVVERSRQIVKHGQGVDEEPRVYEFGPKSHPQHREALGVAFTKCFQNSSSIIPFTILSDANPDSLNYFKRGKIEDKL